MAILAMIIGVLLLLWLFLLLYKLTSSEELGENEIEKVRKQAKQENKI